MIKRRFRPRFWGTVAAAAGVALAIALGNWQVGRAQQKLALAAAQERLALEPVIRLGDDPVNAGEVENRRIEARGQFEADGMVLLDNRVRRGAAGFEVVMPLRLAGGRMYVLVNRGWIAGKGDRRQLPEVRTPSREVVILGRAVVPGKRLYELSSDTTEGRIWQNLTIERYRALLNYPIQPLVIEQSNDIDDGLLRAWPAPDRGVDTHRSYAFQWFALAVLIVVIFVVLSFRRVTTDD